MGITSPSPRSLGWVLGFGLLTAGPIAEGHPGQLRRVLFLEPAQDHLEVLISVTVTGSQRQASWLALADVNRDGRLEKAERARLEAELATYGLDGLRMEVGTASVTLDQVETKLVIDPGQPLVLAMRGTVPLPRSGRLAIVTSKDATPVSVRLLPGRPRMRLSRRGSRGEVVLGPQDRIELLPSGPGPSLE